MYARDPVAELVSKGARVIINISGSPYTVNKTELRLDMLRSLAAANGVPVVYVKRDQFGGNDSVSSSTAEVSSSCPTENVVAQAQLFRAKMLVCI